MTWRKRIAVLSASIVVGMLAWYLFHDSGVTVSLAIATVYVLLLSTSMPLEQWARVDNLRSTLEAGKNPIRLADPCPERDGISSRHVHFEEILGFVSSEKMCRAHGSLKLTGKLIGDVRHDWEKGVLTAFFLLIIWGIFSFGRIPGGVSAPANGAVSFDWWKGAVTALIGFYKLATSAEFLHWFRKQNAQL